MLRIRAKSAAPITLCFTRFAFTLAEVLITLAIIGVVAAMTMPVLISKYQEKVVVTRLKKVYSVLSQAFLSAQGESGDPTDWGLTSSTGEGAENMMNIFLPYLKTMKVCGTASGCWYNNDWLTLSGKLYASGASRDTDPANARLQLADGILVQFTSRSANCTNRGDECGHVHVDVNGAKGPNQLGRDIFFFYLKKDRIIPFGFNGDPVYPIITTCSTTSSHAYNGSGCAAWVIYNENMDYLHCNDLSWNGKTACK